MDRSLPIKVIPAIALVFAIVILSCKKDKDLLAATATIYDTGPTAIDDCRWTIKTDKNTTYSPVNLTNDYKQDNSTVTITYRVLDTPPLSCGFTPGGGGITKIELVDIRKK